MAVSAQNAAKLYEQGKALYDEKKYEAAVAKLKVAAEKGHKKAQYRLGYCFDKGKGVAEDDTKAFYWYSKAAAQDHAKAQYQLGRCYKKGEGTKVDLKKAVDLFQKAAKQGNADAMYALGKCYLKGQGVAADEKKAKTLLLKLRVKGCHGVRSAGQWRPDAYLGLFRKIGRGDCELPGH